MAETAMVVQLSCAATTLEDVYAVPLAKFAVGRVIVCNRAAAAKTYRLAIAPGAAADDPSHYLAYDAALAANTSVEYRGIVLPAEAELRFYGSTADMTVTFTGMESDE